LSFSILHCGKKSRFYNAAVFRQRLLFPILFLLIAFCGKAEAADVHIKKVLPQFIDAKERNSISPSLYERDAYQLYLRNHPEERTGIRFNVLWSGSSKGKNLRLRAELRGVLNNNTQTETLETGVQKTGWFRTWSVVIFRGESYKRLGDLVAWRATLWDGDKQIAEQKSFLW
jgi:hypothetical protein